MSEDFEGTVVDMPEQEEEVSSGDDGEDDKADVANEMGELGKKEHEGLDKNMWAPEDEDNEVCYIVITQILLCCDVLLLVHTHGLKVLESFGLMS